MPFIVNAPLMPRLLKIRCTFAMDLVTFVLHLPVELDQNITSGNAIPQRQAVLKLHTKKSLAMKVITTEVEHLEMMDLANSVP